VDIPSKTIPKEEEVFNEDGLPNIEFIKEHFKKEGRLDPEHIIRIVKMAKNILKEEPNLLALEDPIVGTITF
jgi:serine/threonine-protein phosphatase 2B catalytic subunit